jgi:hypothetical protein
MGTRIDGTPLALFIGMRIQQTDRILKDSRIARHNHEQHDHEPSGNVLSRAWQKLLGVFKR